MIQYPGIPQLVLSGIEINPEVAHLIPRTMATSFMAIPVFRRGQILLMAMQDPSNGTAITMIKKQTNLELQCALADRREIIEQINKHFEANKARDKTL